MRFLSLVSALILGAIIAPSDSAAQAVPEAGTAATLAKSAQKQLGELSKLLNLSDSQKALLSPFLQEEADKVKTLKADDTLSKEDKLTQLKSIKDETSGKMKGVLNDDQWSKLTDWHKQKGDSWWKKGF